MHEASLYDENCFVTLTYDDDHLPPGGSLQVEHYQLFMKRLRKRFVSPSSVGRRSDGSKIRPTDPDFGGVRFFHCGEYGENFARPHYHACLFNFNFPDRSLYSGRASTRLYTSDALNDLWGKGFATIGSLTFNSAAYVARYVTKKITGRMAAKHYEYACPVTGEVSMRKPEYATMSRSPGIGMPWLDLYSSDVFPDDFIVVNGVKTKVPAAYTKAYLNSLSLKESYEQHLSLDLARGQFALSRAHDTTPERLAVRERVTRARLSTFSSRSYEQ